MPDVGLSEPGFIGLEDSRMFLVLGWFKNAVVARSKGTVPLVLSRILL